LPPFQHRCSIVLFSFVLLMLFYHTLSKAQKKGYRLETKSLFSPLYDTPYLVSDRLAGYPNHCHSRLRLSLLFWDEHGSQNPFQGHGMTAHPPAGEEMAVAIPLASIVRNGIQIVISSESHLKLYEMDPLAFLSVTLGLLNFADHTRVHFLLSSPKCGISQVIHPDAGKTKTPRRRQPQCLLEKPI
jgi:hypothetical protein